MPCFPLDAPVCDLLSEALGCACLLAGQSELIDPSLLLLIWARLAETLLWIKKLFCSHVSRSTGLWVCGKVGWVGGCCSSKAVMRSLGRQRRVTSFTEQCKFHITFLMQPICLWTKIENVMSDLICKVFVIEAFTTRYFETIFFLLKFLKPKKYTACFWENSNANACDAWSYLYEDLSLETDWNKHCFLSVYICTGPVVVEFLVVKNKL